MGERKDKVKHLFEDKPPTDVVRYSKGRAAAILSVISVLFCLFSVIGFFWLKIRFSDVDAIKLWIDEHYAAGVILMITVCALQVIVAFVPGELVEIAAGYAFGGWIGALVCTVGIMTGSVIAILLARKFGRRLVESLYPKDIDSLPILNDRKKRNTMVFLLFLIPGTPKDLFTYVVGMTEMSIPLYILLTGVARLPSIIMSTLGGGALGNDRLWLAVQIFVVAGIVSACGYFIYLVIKGRHEKADKS
jgi:uncharacterized membrane protein YdjX (TVP38/TMEM64 family)